MSRAHARESTLSDAESEQTHDDCQWLNEEDGEKDVPGNGCDRNWRDGPPPITRDERRHWNWNNNTRTEDCTRDDADERGSGLTGLLALG